MSTGDFKAEAEQLIRGKVDHLFRAEAIPASGSPFELDVISIGIGFDEAWVPHIQADVTCALPDAEKLALLDARLGCRVEITTGYRYGKDDEESHMMANLHLRSYRINKGNSEITLSLSSDEDLLRDSITYGSERPNRESINAFVMDVVKLTYSDYPFSIYSSFGQFDFGAALEGEPATLTTESTALVGEFGETAWSLLEEAQRRTGTWIYSFNGRDWMITTRPEITSEPVHSLTVGENGTVIENESVLSRDSFYNQVLLRYEWTDETMLPADQFVVGQAHVTGGPFSINTIGPMAYVETIERRMSRAEANAAARDKLTRTLTKGYEFTVLAVAAYWLRAGDTVSLTNGDKTENVLVKSVNFDPAEGTMSLTLRKPEHATITSEA
ncbi:hypothetical protein [Arthrobacter sp. U41]|uniref:hypothetical protein n=1 Tax=Arthrobacter sp. U41 TaxID=1849032 RepID=UPI0008593CD4|nr:hypothetical protein [Arthrobacter sp. U41]AOT04959.1 hypothetical protein ASPU41_18185 [Arthrobacter sp. U41]